MAVDARDVADALAVAWDAFTDAGTADLNGWQVTAAAAEVQPGPDQPEHFAAARRQRRA